MSKHTPGPWRQGFTLITNTTKRWSAKQFADNQQREQRSVYANFNADDQGRSRKLIAVFESQDDAAFAALAPELLNALRCFVGCAYPVASSINIRGHAWCEAYLDEALKIANEAIALAEGAGQ